MISRDKSFLFYSIDGSKNCQVWWEATHQEICLYRPNCKSKSIDDFELADSRGFIPSARSLDYQAEYVWQYEHRKRQGGSEDIYVLFDSQTIINLIIQRWREHWVF